MTLNINDNNINIKPEALLRQVPMKGKKGPASAGAKEALLRQRPLTDAKRKKERNMTEGLHIADSEPKKTVGREVCSESLEIARRAHLVRLLTSDLRSGETTR